jgi:KAP family P-loop domain
VLRPEDREGAAKLGLISDALVELTGGLSADEQARARDLYGGDLTTVPAIAAAASRRRRVLRANYAADSAAAARLLDEDSDDLDIRADVDMLAKLIASKDVRPPLSIGLFGPWGSGKSFLMRQVQLRIRDLSDRSRRKSDEPATGYLREVVPVEFNAWQYAHGSALWAALINRVFEQIQEKLGGDERYQKVLRDIAVKNVGVAQAHEVLDRARAKVDQARPAGEDRVIQDVVKDHDITDEATKKLAAGLNLDTATKQVSDLKSEYDRLMTTTSRLGKGWSTAPLLRKFVVLGLVGIGLAAVVAFILVPAALEQAVALVAGLISIIAAATQVLRPVNQGLEQAAKVLRADDADKQELQQAQDDLDQATQELAAARASGLAGLYGFVSDRTSSAEYRQHLGMAPMIRDDLERLAEMSTNDGGLPAIDRIVIFIDDLDRCPASEVVRVLEAVNLLFGFELFVVVVAVDSRWLLRSLEGTFSEAFDAKDRSAPTPQNYLEKIIQIPFWLQPMQPAGFGRLVTSLAGEVDRPPNRRGSGNASGDRSATLWAGPVAGGQPFHTDEPGEGDVVDAEAAKATGFPGQGGGEKASEESEGRREDDLNPEALRLTEEERDFMLQFHPLVGTPRAVKRFLNTYQLLRVSVDDVKAFLDDQDYKPVLILLALVTGTVPTTDKMIDELRSMDQTNFAVFLEDTQVEEKSDEQDRSGAWEPIASACVGLPIATLTPEVIDAWLPKVARYSFHPVEV